MGCIWVSIIGSLLSQAGDTALFMAILNRNLHLVAFLREVGADSNIPNHVRRSAGNINFEPFGNLCKVSYRAQF